MCVVTESWMCVVTSGMCFAFAHAHMRACVRVSAHTRIEHTCTKVHTKHHALSQAQEYANARTHALKYKDHQHTVTDPYED